MKLRLGTHIKKIRRNYNGVVKCGVTEAGSAMLGASSAVAGVDLTEGEEENA